MTDWSQGEINEVRRGATKTAEELERLNSKTDKALANDRELIEAFNRVGRQLEILTNEIRELRKDLNPALEKPTKIRPLSSAN